MGRERHRYRDIWEDKGTNRLRYEDRQGYREGARDQGEMGRDREREGERERDMQRRERQKMGKREIYVERGREGEREGEANFLV